MLEGTVEFNSLTFNDESLAALDTAPFFWIKLNAADGLFGDEIRYESHPITGGTGERSGPTFRSGKQIVLTGDVYGLGLAELRLGQQALMAAFWDLQPYHLLFHSWELEASSDRMYFIAKVNQPLVMTDEVQALNKYKQSWVVGLRTDDPRSYLESDDSVYPIFQS